MESVKTFVSMTDAAHAPSPDQVPGVLVYEDLIAANAPGIAATDLTPDIEADHLNTFLAGLRPGKTIDLRHTVGLVDPLTAAERPASERVDDGLPDFDLAPVGVELFRQHQRQGGHDALAHFSGRAEQRDGAVGSYGADGMRSGIRDEDRVDALRFQLNSGLDGIFDVLAGHELAHGHAHEMCSHGAFAQPRVGGCPQKGFTH